jgi:menaquinol-cytochrome c reductase cytochrome b/c subunit
MSIEQKEPRVQTQASATQRRYRTLAVVKQEAITRIEKPLEDSVFVWPHLLVREFFASTIVMVMVTLLSIVIEAPLREPANPNFTPNPAKAPWYFLGLQELLHYFPPTTAGVLVPGLTLLALVLLPYVDRNPSRAYSDRKVAIVTFTIFGVFWAVVTLAGSFFRGPGWIWTPLWTWPVSYFDL